MKKWMSILIAALMILSMTAYAAVPSKTTTNASTVVAAESVSGAEIADDFEVVVTEDKETVVQEIEKIYTFVSEGNAPVEYFPVEVSEKIVEKIAEKVAEIVSSDVAAKLPETVSSADIEINEFVTIDEKAYTKSYGSVKASFSFTTVYKPTQAIVALVGVYTGEVDENGEFIVEWIVLDAVANEDGTVDIIFTEEAMLQIQSAQSASLAIVSTVDPDAAAEQEAAATEAPETL